MDRTEEVERPRRGRSPWKVGGARTAGRGHREEGGAKACAASSRRDREVPREGAELWGPETPEKEEEEEEQEKEEEGAPRGGPQQGEVEMCRWSGYLMAGG